MSPAVEACASTIQTGLAKWNLNAHLTKVTTFKSDIRTLMLHAVQVHADKNSSKQEHGGKLQRVQDQCCALLTSNYACATSTAIQKHVSTIGSLIRPRCTTAKIMLE